MYSGSSAWTSSDERSMHRLTSPSAQTPRGIRRQPTALIARGPRRVAARIGDRSSAQRDAGAHDAGALVAQRQGHLGARRRAQHPLDLDPVVGHVRIGPERHAGVLERLAFELADVLAALALDQRRAGGQLDLGDRRRARPCAPARASTRSSAASPVFWTTRRTRQQSPPSASASAATSSSLGEVSACHRSQRGKRATSRSRNCGGGFENAWKRFQPPISTLPSCGWSNGRHGTCASPPSAFSLQRKSLRSSARRVVAEPVDELVVADARLAHRAPDLDHPAKMPRCS